MIKDEDKRLQSVRKFHNLTFAREKELQDIVKLAAEVCSTPIALITLMDKDVQYITFREGTSVTENTRANSFCKYLVNEKNIMEVSDALNDNRFSANPLVVNAPNLRFYAGAPLTTHDDQHLGTLCVFDQQPKKLSETQKEMLAILSRQVMNLMELEMNASLLESNLKVMKLREKEAELAEFKIQSFFESSAICHFLVGQQLEVLFFNKMAALTIAQLHGEKMIYGRKLTDFVSAGLTTIINLHFEKALAGETSKNEYLLTYPNGNSIWWDIEFSPAYNSVGKIVGVSINAVNIDERKNQTEKILVQNAALRKVAQMQSHEFRPTVANIISLISILKEEKHWRNNKYFHLLEQSTNELDKKIRAVVEYAVLIPGL